MENTIDKYPEERESWRVTTDLEGEWALIKIKEHQDEYARYTDVCNSMIQTYQDKIKQAEDKLQNGTGYLKGLLLEYFQTVPHKSTKTQETYALPSGKLKLKTPAPEFVRDDAKLMEWLKGRGMGEYIKVTESAQWSEFKKIIKQQDNFVCIDGEIVEGITLVERPPTFEVEV